RDHDEVEDAEGPDEAVRQVGGIGADDFGQAECEQDRGDEGREPGPGPAGTGQRDTPGRARAGPGRDGPARPPRAARAATTGSPHWTREGRRPSPSPARAPPGSEAAAMS